MALFLKTATSLLWAQLYWEHIMEATGIIGLLILLGDIYAILKIAQSSATNGSKALWILVVLVLPLVGLILWFFLGPGGRSG